MTLSCPRCKPSLAETTMKEVTVTVTLLMNDDQPACDWIYESIAEQLHEGEQILYYSDSEPVVGNVNTDEQKIDALTELLSNVIHSLEMTQYEIGDVSEAANVVREADKFHQQMLDILHNEAYTETLFGASITEEQADKFDAWLD